ncbi:MAG: hypothetical protein PVG11_04900 [Anaerolineae bacterium]|jgi:hypothetical protein
MTPVEYVWITLFVVLAVVGSARGLSRELGVSTIMLLSLFALKFGWEQVGSRITGAVGGSLPTETVMAAYYAIPLIFIAFISYEGFSLAFPVQSMGGVGKAIFGFVGGLLNGYLIVGSIWDVVAQAEYLGLQVPYGSANTTIAIAESVTDLHNMLVQYMPITFVDEFVMLALGMILLLAIVLK